MTTRAELEADIAELTSLRFRGGPTWQNPAIDRAIARLCRDLAKLDGPAEGFVRVRIATCVASDGRWAAGGAWHESPKFSEDQSRISGNDRVTWITADVRKPVPQVAEEIEGEVCDG